MILNQLPTLTGEMKLIKHAYLQYLKTRFKQKPRQILREMFQKIAVNISTISDQLKFGKAKCKPKVLVSWSVLDAEIRILQFLIE